MVTLTDTHEAWARHGKPAPIPLGAVNNWHSNWISNLWMRQRQVNHMNTHTLWPFIATEWQCEFAVFLVFAHICAVIHIVFRLDAISGAQHGHLSVIAKLVNLFLIAFYHKQILKLDNDYDELRATSHEPRQKAQRASNQKPHQN